MADQDRDRDALGQPASLKYFDRHVARVGWRSWSALGALGALIGVVLVWSVLGDVPTRVAGSCIIMHPQGVFDVTADAPGRITALLVRPGSLVQAGQEVALVATPELFEKIAAVRVQLADLEAEARIVREELARSASLAVDSNSEQRSSLSLRAQSDQKRIRILEQQIEINERMRKDGLITARAMATTPLDLADARTNLAETERKLAEIDKREADYARKNGSSLAKLDWQVNEVKRNLATLESHSAMVTRLRSSTAGRVVEVKAALDSAVKRDTPVLSVERLDGAGATLEAVMFVSAADGKKIALQDQAEITPSHARREEHGVMQARVISSSAYPSTPQGMLNTIANPDLMRELAHGSATYEVRLGLPTQAALAPGAANPYRWSNSNGSALALTSGTLCAGEILVQHERPLAMVLPIFRSTVNGKH